MTDQPTKIVLKDASYRQKLNATKESNLLTVNFFFPSLDINTYAFEKLVYELNRAQSSSKIGICNMYVLMSRLGKKNGSFQFLSM